MLGHGGRGLGGRGHGRRGHGGRGHGGHGHGEPEMFGQFYIFGKFTKDHLADLSRLLGLVSFIGIDSFNTILVKKLVWKITICPKFRSLLIFFQFVA